MWVLVVEAEYSDLGGGTGVDKPDVDFLEQKSLLVVVSVVADRGICGRVGTDLVGWVVVAVVAGLVGNTVLVDGTAVDYNVVVLVAVDDAAVVAGGGMVVEIVGVEVEEENNLVELGFGFDIEDVAEEIDVDEEEEKKCEIEDEIVNVNVNVNENENENGRVGAAEVVEAHMDLSAEVFLLDIHPLLL